MDKYEMLLTRYLKDNKISMDEYVQLNNTNIINIKTVSDLINSHDIELKDSFNEKYNSLIKYKDSNIIFKNKVILNRLIKKSNLTYTTDQSEGIDNIVRFLTDPTKKLFGLFGYAGTGKTTTIIDFIINSIELKYINSVVFTAPTNKALNVIKNKICDKMKYLLHKNNIEYNTNISFDMNIEKLKKHNITIEFQTIHRLLKFKTEYNTDGGISFIKDKDNILEDYNIIIVDECSMIPLNIIYEILKESNKTNNKIIFTGDPAQLPPVNEKTSSIFMTANNKCSISKLKTHIGDISEKDYENFCGKIINMDLFVLKKIVRTNNNNVIECCNIIRDWIYNINEFENIANHVDLNVNLYSNDKTQKIKTSWYKEFEKLIKFEKDTIIIAWTNEEVKSYNNNLRKSKFSDKNNISEYEIGDILILNEYYSLNNEQDSKSENKVKFNTSEKIVVTKLELINYEIEKLDNTLKKNIKAFQNHRSIETKYKKFVDKINLNDIKVKCYKMKVKKIDEEANEYEIYVLSNDTIQIHKKIEFEIIEEIKKFRNDLLNQYKIISIDQLIIQPLYNEFYSKFINKFASVSYGYAITCHKAQGSNYKNVFVDFSDIVKNNNSDEMKRCTYTAVSRTINTLHILI